VEISVASPLRLATDAGIEAGRHGGNAIDAALTTAAMLTVAYPASCAIGGDLLALVREPDGRVTFVNASGAAFGAIDPDAVRSRYAVMPSHGPLSITVPGMVAGWESLWRRGAALSWRDLLAPAHAAADDGVPVSAGLAASIAETVPNLRGFADLAALLAPDGQPLTVGDTLRQPALARSLGALRDGGARVMYEGELSNALCTGLAARGVPIAMDDLRDFRVEESAPLAIDVGPWRVQAGRPNSQAYLVPRLLGMLETIGGAENTPLHRRVPADRLALAFYLAQRERDAVVADPRAMTQDVEALLTPVALRDFAARVMSSSAEGLETGSSTRHPTGDTVAVVAADSEGRSVSLIQSLFNGFGSLILEPATGIVMHNRGACFVLDPASPNTLAPGKRPMHTLSPVLAEAVDGSQRLAVGTMGGHGQPQILTQVLSQLFAGVGAQDAVSRARMTVGAWEDYESPDVLAYESDLDAAMVSELAAFSGNQLEVEPHHSRMGHAHAIRVHTSRWKPDVGTDPRADGLS
jgi:gamma-glutamyltranspeptidase/glutathione hydrolase